MSTTYALGPDPRRYSHAVREAREVVAAHLPELEEPSRATAEALVALVLDALGDAQHERKWGRLTFTRGNDWHHWICAVSVAKAGVRLTFHKGALLGDPGGVLEGDGRYARAILFRSPDEVDAGVVAPNRREAAARQTEM